MLTFNLASAADEAISAGERFADFNSVVFKKERHQRQQHVKPSEMRVREMKLRRIRTV